MTAEFSRRVDIQIIKDEPKTPLEWAEDHPGIGLADGKIAYGDYLKHFQPYRWRAVAANNEPLAPESYYNAFDAINTAELLFADDTTVYLVPMFGEDRSERLLRYGKTDRDKQASVGDASGEAPE